MTDGKFEAVISDRSFCISITQESDWSADGGHTLENATNSWDLSRQEAVELYEKLKRYLGDGA